jgi:hypothetical protein
VRLNALFRLAFATAAPLGLTSPHTANSQAHSTCPLSVTKEYLGLAGGPARFARDFSGPVLLGMTLKSPECFVYGGNTLYADPFKAFDYILDF